MDKHGEWSAGIRRPSPRHPVLDHMPNLTYTVTTNRQHKPLVWLSGEIKTPPMSREARLEAGYLLRMLQAGDLLALPHSRPMPIIVSRCHELRINDRDTTWRVVYRVDPDAVLILEVFQKKSTTTPRSVIANCRKRAKAFDATS